MLENIFVAVLGANMLLLGFLLALGSQPTHPPAHIDILLQPAAATFERNSANSGMHFSARDIGTVHSAANRPPVRRHSFLIT